MAASPELLLDVRQLGHHAFASRFPPDSEIALLVLAAVTREAQEVERLRFSFPSPFSISLGPFPELDQPRLVRVQFQSELR